LTASIACNDTRPRARRPPAREGKQHNDQSEDYKQLGNKTWLATSSQNTTGRSA